MRRLASVAVVFAGLLAFITATSLLAAAIWSFQLVGTGQQGALLSAIAGMVPAAAAALLGYYLIANRQDLPAQWFEDEPLDVPVDPADLMRLGLILLGLSLGVSALASILSTATFMVREISENSFAWWRVIDFTGPVLQLVLGLILVFKSQTLAERLWHGAVRVEPQDDLPKCAACGAPYDLNDYEDDVTARCAACGEQLASRA